MRRPVGITILGILWIFAGGGGLFSPLDKPVLSFGIIHSGGSAYILHIVPKLIGIYLGYSLLKPFWHAWYLYFLITGIGMCSLTLNLMYEPKIWELCLLIQPRADEIPRLVRFTQDVHYLLIALYALTSLYVFIHKQYFWGESDL